LDAEFLHESAESGVIGVEGIRAAQGQDTRQRAQLLAALRAASADRDRRGIRPRQPFRRHRGRGRRAPRRHLHRIHDCEDSAVVGIAEHDHPLDGGPPVATRVAGEIAVGLGREVAAPEVEARGLDVEPTLPRRHTEDGGGQASALGVQTESRLHGGDALVQAEQRLDVVTREDERLRRVQRFLLKAA
jgi:hypothetical protein